MITFNLSLSTGQTFKLTNYSYEIFQSVLDKFFQEKCLTNYIMKVALIEGNKIDLNKTLIENNIKNGSKVVIMLNKNENNTLNNDNYLNSDNFIMNNLINYGLDIDELYPVNIPIFGNSFYNPSPQIINQNHNIITAINFLTNECNIKPEMLDGEGNCLGNWRINQKNGPPECLKDYDPPLNWIGVGLKVLNLYDNRDNTWLSTLNIKGEWYIAYHPIKSINSISGILKNGFRKGPYQDCKNYINLNPLNNRVFPLCGEGVYFIPNIGETKKYTQVFEYLGKKFRIAFMCRINPYKVRIAENEPMNESWIVNGDNLNDPFGRKRDDEVRPYRILFFMEN